MVLAAGLVLVRLAVALLRARVIVAVEQERQVTARAASQQIITVRRGRLSAMSARNSPPITHGMYPAAYVAAASSGDLVRS